MARSQARVECWQPWGRRKVLEEFFEFSRFHEIFREDNCDSICSTVEALGKFLGPGNPKGHFGRQKKEERVIASNQHIELKLQIQQITSFQAGLVPSNCACLKVLLLSSISRSALLSKFARSKFCSMKLSLTPSLLW